jgi:site-specific DNA recombinase
MLKNNLVTRLKKHAIRKLMYELFLQHQRRATVARILNERGYKTRKGKNFSDITVTRLLKNPDAKGIRKSNHHGVESIKYPKGKKPKEEWIFTKCPQIVSEKLWDSANAIIEEQESRSKHRKPLNQRVHLFTSYIKCHNGYKMGIQTKTNKYSCTKCKVRIDKDDLEEVFSSRLSQFILSEEEIKNYTSSSDKIINDKKEEVNSITKQIDDIDIRLNQLIDLNIKGQIPTKGYNSHYNPLFEQSEKLQQTLKNLNIDLEEMKKVNTSFDSVVHQSKGLYENWYSLGKLEKCSIIEAVTNTIIFNGETLNFKLKQIAPLSSLELKSNGQHNGTI